MNPEEVSASMAKSWLYTLVAEAEDGAAFSITREPSQTPSAVLIGYQEYQRLRDLASLPDRAGA